MKDHGNERSFKEKLDEHYDWPAKYLFKFIVPAGKEQEIKDIFPSKEGIQLKSSSGGKYTSVSADIIMDSSDAVMDIYREAYKVEGVISL